MAELRLCEPYQGYFRPTLQDAFAKDAPISLALASNSTYGCFVP